MYSVQMSPHCCRVRHITIWQLRPPRNSSFPSRLPLLLKDTATLHGLIVIVHFCATKAPKGGGNGRLK